MKCRAIAILFAAIALAGCGNQHQKGVDEALAGDPRNEGIKVRVHVSGDILTFDLREVPEGKSRLDVSRVLLQAARQIHKETHEPYDEVVLAFQGKNRFKFAGSYFHQLGAEYGEQNPIYTLRTLPENVQNLDGTRAFPTWTGGLFSVLAKQTEELNEFHDRWYFTSLSGNGK